MYRFVSQKLHAYLDYPVALALIVLPLVLGIGAQNAVAFGLSVFAGIGALLMTSLTDHETGLVPVLPYRIHLFVDAVVGVVFVAAPTVMGLAGLDAAYFWIIGAAVLIVVNLHRGEEASVLPAE